MAPLKEILKGLVPMEISEILGKNLKKKKITKNNKEKMIFCNNLVIGKGFMPPGWKKIYMILICKMPLNFMQ